MSSVAKIPLLPQPTLQSLTDNLDLSPESLSSPAIEQLRVNVNIIQKTRATYNFTDLSLDSVPTFKLSLKKAVENSFREALEFAQEEEQDNQNEIEAVEVPQTKTSEVIKRINPRKLERKVSLVTEDKAQEHNVDLIYDGDRKVNSFKMDSFNQ